MIAQALINLRSIVEGGGGVLEIDAAVVPVAAMQDPQSITPLLLMLRETDDDNGMWSILHAAEKFDHSTYVSSVMAALPEMVSVSPYWASIVIMRLLNSDAARAELVRQLQGSSVAAKDAAKRLCEKINESDVRFMAKTTAVLIAAR
jgi:hypothetical protein